MQDGTRQNRDQQLARLLRDDDPGAYEAIYAAYLPDVLALLAHGISYAAGDGTRGRVHVPSAFDREELCQETFAQFFRQCASGRFDPARAIFPYLRRIAMNLTFRHLRARKREVAEEAEPVDDTLASEPAVSREARRLVGEFRDELGDRERAVLAHYFEGEASQEEVGAALSLSRDQVYRSIVRIRRTARSFFGARGWLDEP